MRLSRRTLAVALSGLAICALVGSFVLFGPAGRERESAPAGSSASSPAEVDSAALASDAKAECGTLAGQERTSCYDRHLLALVSAKGLRPALATLSRLAADDPDVQRNGHAHVHAIGIAAYEPGMDVAEVFAACTPVFQSGCYHGVIQAYFEKGRKGDPSRAVSSADVNGLCTAYKTGRPDRWLHFTCVHGMGHGLTMFYDHDLPRALSDCDLLTDTWEREACYGGAFMENVVNAITPHHTHGAEGQGSPEAGAEAEHHAAAGTGGGEHVHGAAATEQHAQTFKALDPQDLQYPCSIVEDKYLLACYTLQTSAILAQNKWDIGGAAKVCDDARGGFAWVCYLSLGRDISSYVLQDHAEAARLCSLGTPRYRPWCFAGVLKDIAYGPGRTENGIAFCRSVPGHANKLKCYEALGEQIAVVERDVSRQAALCAGGEGGGGYVEACRYGARLIFAPPPGLPLVESLQQDTLEAGGHAGHASGARRSS